MNLRASYGLDECVFHGKSRPESARQSASNFAREPITNLQTPHGNVVQLTGEPGQAGFATFENAIADSHPALQRQTTVCRLQNKSSFRKVTAFSVREETAIL